MVAENNVTKEVQDQVRDLVGRNVPFLAFCNVNHEVRAEKLEPRIVAMSNYRLFILLTLKGGQLKVEHSVPYMDINSIESKLPHKLILSTSRKFVFYVREDNAEYIDTLVYPIIEFTAKVFPKVPLEDIISRFEMKHEKAPKRKEAILERVDPLREKDVGPCDGFSAAYKCACDYHSLLYMDEVAWDIDTIYLAHATKELSLSDFDHLDSKYLVPIITALQFNTWFTAFNASRIKLSADAILEVNKVMKTNTTIEELVLSHTGLRSDHIQVLCLSLLANNSCPLTKLDLSHNPIQDSGLNHLCGPLTKLSRGLVHLNLSSTGLTARGINRLAETLSSSKLIPTTLRTLNLSHNIVKADELVTLYQFLAMPNAITSLNLSGMECLLEPLFAALLRGCCQNLQELDLSGNLYAAKKAKEVTVPMAWQEFFSSALVLNDLNLSGCKLPPEAVKFVLLGISSNESIEELKLDLSSCSLGQQGSQVLEAVLPSAKNITSLNLSNNGIEAGMASLLGKISQNQSIRHLYMGRNLNYSKASPKRYVTSSMDAAVGMIHQDDSQLETLSFADSKLRSDTMILLNALGSNITLTELDISGNLMGDAGARSLSKALQINTRLRVIHWDKNNTSPQGFHDIAGALKKNYTMRVMPTPVHDASQAIKINQVLTEDALKTIEALLQRNHSPHKFGGEQAYRLQQGFLNTSAHQLLDEPSLKLQECLSELEKNEQAQQVVSYDLEQAHKVLKEVNRSRQLMLKLQHAAATSDDADAPIAKKLVLIGDDLQDTMQTTLETSVKNMMACAEEECPTIMEDEELRRDIDQETREKCVLPSSFSHTLIQEQVALDIANKVNSLNLAAATEMSDRILDGAIDAMNKTEEKLKGYINMLKSGMSLENIQASLRKSLIRGSSMEAEPKLAAKDGLKPSQARQTRALSRMVRPKTMDLSLRPSEDDADLQPIAPARKSTRKPVPPPAPETLPPSKQAPPPPPSTPPPPRSTPPPPPSTPPPNNSRLSPVPKPRSARKSRMGTPPLTDGETLQKNTQNGTEKNVAVLKETKLSLAGSTTDSSRTEDNQSVDNSPVKDENISVVVAKEDTVASDDDEGVAMERDDTSMNESEKVNEALAVDKSLESLDSIDSDSPAPSREGTPGSPRVSSHDSIHAFDETESKDLLPKEPEENKLPQSKMLKEVVKPKEVDHKEELKEEQEKEAELKVEQQKEAELKVEQKEVVLTKVYSKEAEPSEPEKVEPEISSQLSSHEEKKEKSSIKTEDEVKGTPDSTPEKVSAPEKAPPETTSKDSTDGHQSVLQQSKTPKTAPSRKSPEKSKDTKKSTALKDLPSLNTDAPRLEHVAKTRPKRAKTRAPTRPTVITSPEEPDNEVDDFFSSNTTTPTSPSPASTPQKEENKTKAPPKPSTKQQPEPSKPGKFSGLLNKFKTKGKQESKHVKEKPEPDVKEKPVPETKEKSVSEIKEEPSEEDQASEPQAPEVAKPKRLPGIGLPGMGMGGALMAEFQQKRESAFPGKGPIQKDEKKTALKPPDTSGSGDTRPVRQSVLPSQIAADRSSGDAGEKPLLRAKPARLPTVAPKPRASTGPKPPLPGAKPQTGGPPVTAPKPVVTGAPLTRHYSDEGDKSPLSQRKSTDSSDGTSKTSAVMDRIAKLDNNNEKGSGRARTLPHSSTSKTDVTTNRSLSADQTKNDDSQSNGSVVKENPEIKL